MELSLCALVISELVFVLAELFNVVGSGEFRHTDINSSIGQGHCWILVDRFVRLAEAYFA